MKISKPLKKQILAEKISGNKKGVALVLVLTVMSLATIMILTFFSLATSEHRSSATYSQGLQAQQVAEQAVNLVISQIRKATAKSDVAWASQPGAIRTWSSNGQFNVGFKLYSDDVLLETSELKLNDDDFKDAQNWASRPSEFVDLNEPVIRGGKVYFPIVDPSARDLPKWPAKIGGETDDAGVEGFDFNFDSAHTISPGDYDKLVKEKNSVGHLALPVRWIYQLADGTLGTINGSAFTALSGNATPSVDNQIVGRFAFWADDETAKLNLNVHSGGLAWDTPRAGGDMDMDMAKYQPLQHEWQRYPGHPATTHLVPTLAPGVLDIVRNKNAMEMIFATVPRIVGGGSESGTRKANPRDPKERDGLIPDKNPLFPSVDEYVMAPDRKPNYFPQADGRPAPEETMVDMMERVRFFLTTTSRAPETTLFNTPRIATWPIHKTNHTAFDRMIEFCSTINQKKYIFERKNADSATEDYNDLPRNRELYKYLAKLTGSNIPGVGAGFNDKFQEKDRLQILTQIFDYIRCTNLHDDSLFGQDWESALKKTNSNQHITYTNPRKGNPDLAVEGQSGIHKGHGQVTPIEIKEGGVTTKGFGRFYTLSDVAIHAICVADGGDGGIQANYAEALGGASAGPRYPGFDVYQSSRIRVDALPAFSNFPPLHIGAAIDNIATYPEWLTDWLDAYLNHEGEWVEVGGVEPPNTLLPKGNWRDRFNWRNFPPPGEPDKNPRTRAINLGYWQEVLNIIRPVFEQENWNWNLMFNRVQGGTFAPIPVEVDIASGDGRTKKNTQFNREVIAQDHFMRLGPHEKLVQAAMIFNMFCPSMGWVPINPDMSVKIEMEDKGDDFKFVTLGSGGTLKPRVAASDARYGKNKIYATNVDDTKYGRFLVHRDLEGKLLPLDPREWWYSNDMQTAHHHRHAGGPLPFTYIMGADAKNRGKIGPLNNLDVQVRHPQTGTNTTGRLTPLDPEFYSPSVHEGNQYSFITAPFRIGPSDLAIKHEDYLALPVEGRYKLKMRGGKIKFEIYSHGDKTNSIYAPRELSAPQADKQLVQTIEVNIPSIVSHPPMLAVGREGYINEFKAEEHQPVTPMEMWSLGVRGAQPGMSGRLFRLSTEKGQLFHANDVVQSVGTLHGDVRVAAVQESIKAGDEVYGPHFRYAKYEGNGGETFTRTEPEIAGWPSTYNDALAAYGDAPLRSFSRMAHDMAMSTGFRYEGGDGRLDRNYSYNGNDLDTERSMQILPGLNFNGKLPMNAIGDRKKYGGLLVNRYGDFDNNMGLLVDGCYINKPDEGNSHSLYQRTSDKDLNAWELRRDYGDFPYFVRDWLHEAGSPSYFSPNRITSGPGMFGSLPSGALQNKPWQTLLFRPAAGSGHPGAPSKTYDGKSIPGGKDPADHYFLDLFWMPVVEPYAISEPLSTAGKVNLNYQILPFRNVKRNSSMRGIFRSELMVLVPTKGYDPTKSNNTGAPSLYTKEYKHNSGRGSGWHWRDKPNGGFLQGKRLRAVIQEPRTLDQFQQRFDAGKIFKSASEICEVHLVPQQVAERMGITTSRNQLVTYTPEVAQMENGKFWKDHAAIGDNSRERAYGNIYSRVTTKSNTFKVHYRGQVLKQGRRLDNNYSAWDPELDSVVGEYRGSSIVERYLDPNSDQIIDYAAIIGGSGQTFQQITANPNYHTIDDYHRFRIVNPTRFAP